jgi:hypothetical protein
MSLYSIVEYTASAAQTDFTISMPYLLESHIEVRVDSVLKTVTTHYSFADSTTIRFVLPMIGGEVVQIARVTNRSTRLVDFAAGARLTENDLDTAFLQTFYVMQEAFDSAGNAFTLDSGEWDAQGYRIKNVGDANSTDDACNYSSIQAIAAGAPTSAAAAYVSEQNALASETAAAASAAAAVVSANAASASASAAASSAIDAQTAETNAETAQALAEAAVNSHDIYYFNSDVVLSSVSDSVPTLISSGNSFPMSGNDSRIMLMSGRFGVTFSSSQTGLGGRLQIYMGPDGESDETLVWESQYLQSSTSAEQCQMIMDPIVQVPFQPSSGDNWGLYFQSDYAFSSVTIAGGLPASLYGGGSGETSNDWGTSSYYSWITFQYVPGAWLGTFS